VLTQAVGRLAPGGVLAVRTANIRSAAFAKNPLKRWAFGVDHRFYFSPASLTAALEAAGLAVCDILNLEPLERPYGKRRLSLSRDPRHVVRHLLNYMRYGNNYWTSLMTIIG